MIGVGSGEVSHSATYLASMRHHDVVMRLLPSPDGTDGRTDGGNSRQFSSPPPPASRKEGAGGPGRGG